uniref:STAS domain-containing protein n=1 Tax=Kalanchoe fedtschenkoi TaxID=63787 RepID=A0A7N0VC94_KALFE
MGNSEFESCKAQGFVAVPPAKPFAESLKSSLREVFFPDDPFRGFKNQPLSRKFLMGLQYFVPIFDWAPRYNRQYLKSDIVAGITIASLAVPQGISYANLAKLPPIIGLYSSFIPPLIYAILGSSRDLAIGTIAVGSLLIFSMIGKEVNPIEQMNLYIHLAFTATFFAGIFQASLGFLRLGFIVDLLSHATIVGFMGGAATVVCLQQLRAMFGLEHFTHNTDIISVMKSVSTQFHQWRWESLLLGVCFLSFLLVTKYFSKKKPGLFWISAMAPLVSVILGSLLVYVTHGEQHGVKVIGPLKSGVNRLSIKDLEFGPEHLHVAIRTGIVIGTIAMAEGVAVGRSFATYKNYHIDGNKEMIAFGLMNIVGSCTSCYLTSGPFSRTAVNCSAGGKTAVSNIVMAVAVLITLLFLTPLFYYTPMVVLASIIFSAMLGLVDYEAAIHLWKIDKFDFVICISAYVGVVFGSVETGLEVAVAISLIRVLLYLVRPRTSVLGSIPNSEAYRSMDQYPLAKSVPGVLILQMSCPIYFTNASYLRERISRWIAEEEDKSKSSGESSLQYLILDMSAVGSIDTSGISMLQDVRKQTDRKGIKLVLANPGSEVVKKLGKSKFIEEIGREWIHLSVGHAVAACNFTMLSVKQKNVDVSAGDFATPDIV